MFLQVHPPSYAYTSGYPYAAYKSYGGLSGAYPSSYLGGSSYLGSPYYGGSYLGSPYYGGLVH